jgi:hypothetical protein
MGWELWGLFGRLGVDMRFCWGNSQKISGRCKLMKKIEMSMALAPAGVGLLSGRTVGLLFE